jgi:hypothetical protein
MSSLVYPRGTDLRKLSVDLLWQVEWPTCMECSGPLSRIPRERPQVKNAGKCYINGNVAGTYQVNYVTVRIDLFCLFCGECYEAPWYFFYSLSDSKPQLVDNFWSMLEAPRLGLVRVNPKASRILEGVRL